MKALKSLILTASLSIFASPSAYAQPLTPLAACEQELEQAVNQCADVMKKAEELNYAIRAESNTRQAIINDQKDEIRHLERELSSAKAWYRDPMVVAPTAAALTLLLVGMIKWH